MKSFLTPHYINDFMRHNAMSQIKLNLLISPAKKKLLYPEKFAHHLLLLFYSLKYEKGLFLGFPPMY